MVRAYQRYKITGTGEKGKKVVSEGVCLKTEDPLAVAFRRDRNLLPCNRVHVESWDAFSLEMGREWHRVGAIPKMGGTMRW